MLHFTSKNKKYARSVVFYACIFSFIKEEMLTVQQTTAILFLLFSCTFAISSTKAKQTFCHSAYAKLSAENIKPTQQAEFCVLVHTSMQYSCLCYHTWKQIVEFSWDFLDAVIPGKQFSF